MTTINTIGGPIAADRLGVTYMHEHIFIVDPAMEYYWPGYKGWDEDALVEKARTALRKLHDEVGVHTILDPTVPGLGRNIRAVARAVEGTGLNVIAATGWYAFSELPPIFSTPFCDLDTKISELEALFVRHVEEGLDGTSIKPGVIKCSTDAPGITEDIEALLRATARAHLRTGLPITTHTDSANRGGLLQQAIFQQEGVDMGAVVIGHCNQSDHLGYLEELIENGSLIGFDRCGLESPVAHLDKQLDNLAELCRRGYSKRIVLSHDRMVYQQFVPEEMLKAMFKYDPADPYVHVDGETLPGLRERGVTEQQIADMLVEAPREYFSRSAAGAA